MTSWRMFLTLWWPPHQCLSTMLAEFSPVAFLELSAFLVCAEAMLLVLDGLPSIPTIDSYIPRAKRPPFLSEAFPSLAQCHNQLSRRQACSLCEVATSSTLLLNFTTNPGHSCERAFQSFQNLLFCVLVPKVPFCEVEFLLVAFLPSIPFTNPNAPTGLIGSCHWYCTRQRSCCNLRRQVSLVYF
jgi:hypothetical protein